MPDETTSTVTPSAETVPGATPAPQPGEGTQTAVSEPGATTETPKPETDDVEQRHALPKGVQKRIDRLTRDKYRLLAELEVARKQAPTTEQRPAAPGDGAPKADQFKTYEEYLEARAGWRAREEVSKAVEELRQTTQRQAGQAEQEKLASAWQKRVDEASGVYDDFEEVALSPEVPISEPMMAAILRSPKGADVAYYLGKNPDKAAEIAGLDPTTAAIRIGEIGATISRPNGKKTTSAPAPIEPVGGRAGPQKDPDKMSTAEWMRWRNEQAGPRRR